MNLKERSMRESGKIIRSAAKEKESIKMVGNMSIMKEIMLILRKKVLGNYIRIILLVSNGLNGRMIKMKD